MKIRTAISYITNENILKSINVNNIQIIDNKFITFDALKIQTRFKSKDTTIAQVEREAIAKKDIGMLLFCDMSKYIAKREIILENEKREVAVSLLYKVQKRKQYKNIQFKDANFFLTVTYPSFGSVYNKRKLTPDDLIDLVLYNRDLLRKINYGLHKMNVTFQQNGSDKLEYIRVFEFQKNHTLHAHILFHMPLYLLKKFGGFRNFVKKLKKWFSTRNLRLLSIYNKDSRHKFIDSKEQLINYITKNLKYQTDSLTYGGIRKYKDDNVYSIHIQTFLYWHLPPAIFITEKVEAEIKSANKVLYVKEKDHNPDDDNNNNNNNSPNNNNDNNNDTDYYFDNFIDYSYSNKYTMILYFKRLQKINKKDSYKLKEYRELLDHTLIRVINLLTPNTFIKYEKRIFDTLLNFAIQKSKYKKQR